MAEVEAAKVPAVEAGDIDKVTSTELKDDVQQNGDPKAPTQDSEKPSEKNETAHEEDRRMNESARVREARQYNNRDKNKHGGNRGNNHYQQKPFTRNNKFDASSLPESNDPDLIRKQVEFYFSDSNLHSDKFLFTHIEGSTNNPVPIDVIHKFKRMQRFQPRSAIVTALKESKTLNLVNDDNDIQRKVPLPDGLVGKPIHEIKEVHENKHMAQSVYAKGFGDEEASSQFDIEAFFAKYGTTNSVRLRRDTRHNFKGSVFVEFDTEEQAKSFVALDPLPKYKDQELIVKTKKEYCDAKVEDIKAGKVRPSSQDRGGRGGFNNKKRERDDGDDRDWRERRDEEAKDGFRGGRGRGGRSRGPDRGQRGQRGHGRGRGSYDRDRNARRSSPAYGDDTEQKAASAEIKAKTWADGGDAATVEKPSAGDAKASEPDKPNNTSGEGPSVPPAEASKKRQREGNDTTAEEPPAKKIDDKVPGA